MKKLIKCLVIMMMLTMAVLMMSERDTYAATKKAKVTYTLKKGTVTIKGKGEMPRSMNFSYNPNVKKVVIKRGVTSIPNYAFKECNNLKEVKIANTVKKIGRSSFYATGIEKITIPASVKTIGNHAFGKCRKLTTITMPGDFEVTNVRRGIEESVLIMTGKKIKTVNFNTNFNYEISSYIRGSKWNVRKKDPNYKSINGIIYTKDGKELVRVPKQVKQLNIAEGCEVFCLQATNYYEIGPGSEAFSPCKENLETIVIPSTMKKIDREKYMTSDFDHSYLRLKDISIKAKELDKESISMLINEFTEVDGMVEKIVEQFPDRIKVENSFCILDDTVLIWYLEKDIKTHIALTVTVPEGIKEIARRAFYEDKHHAIYEITLPEGVEVIGEEAFGNIVWLRKVELPNSLKKIGDRAFSGDEKLTEINLPSGLESIGTGAFEYSGINKIIIPENVKVWGTNVFAGTGFEEITLPDSMTTIPKRMFENCYKLKEINLPKNLKTIAKEAFSGCESLKEVNLPNSLNYIGAEAFVICKNLQVVNLPNSLTHIGSRAFAGTALKKVVVPSNVSKWGAEVFYNTELEEAVLPENMTVIPEGFFGGAYKLKKVNIPPNLKEIKGLAFYGTNVDIQKFLNCKSLRTVGQDAFSDIIWTKLTIPKHIKKIGSSAFAYYKKRKIKRKVIFKGNTKKINKEAFTYDGRNVADITFEFKDKFKNSFTVFELGCSYNNKKVSFTCVKLKNVDGYDIRLYTDKKFKKLLKKTIAKKNKKSISIKLKKKDSQIYVKARPYKTINGKKVYGKWSTKWTHVYDI